MLATQQTTTKASLTERISAWKRTRSNNELLLVIVDQLEELVTMCADRQERMAFLEQLRKALDSHGECLRLVVGLRSDFEPQFTTRETPLYDYWLRQTKGQAMAQVSEERQGDGQASSDRSEAQHQGDKAEYPARFLVRPMTQDELREVIVRPAQQLDLDFESDEMVEQLVNEVLQMPGALPLLSFTLSALFSRYLERPSEDQIVCSVLRTIGR